jgi:hypothetical protein
MVCLVQSLRNNVIGVSTFFVRLHSRGQTSRLAHLSDALAGKSVALLTARDLSMWRDGLKATKLAPSTVNRATTVLKAALSRLFNDQPDLQADMLLTGRLLCAATTNLALIRSRSGRRSFRKGPPRCSVLVAAPA